jgi:hypothetical protein
MDIASIGFRSKTARAIAIAVGGSKSAPRYLARWEIALHDPLVSGTAQPHHQVMELAWSDALSAVRQLEMQIAAVATERLAGLLEDLRSRGQDVRSIAVVGSPDRDLEKIGNRHMRAHAGEGILFRRVLETAATEHRIKWASFSDREFEMFAVSRLGRTPQDIQKTLAMIGQAAGRPWRADERAAATAAWLTLYS